MQRLHVEFTTDPRFDNPRAVQIRLPGFDLHKLRLVGCKVRDIYAAMRRIVRKPSASFGWLTIAISPTSARPWSVPFGEKSV